MDLSRFRTLAKNWEAFGQRDPMFGVLSDPTKQHGRWAADEFFESGRAHVAKLFRVLAEHDATFTAGRALDFGCGVGRLTLPIAERFEQTVGVDVARSMIQLARRHNPTGSRCEFVVNRDPDLRQFADRSFDFVHTCLVLQHIPSEVSRRYIGEFLRIARPGGLVVFQVPAQVFTDDDINARLALPARGYRAHLDVTGVPVSPGAGESFTVNVRIRNDSDVEWRLDIPGGRHISVANHWLDAQGEVVSPDDGRARLPRDLAPGQAGDVQLQVTAPPYPGSYVLEVDLVQERICWFAQKGLVTARVPIVVGASALPTVQDTAPPTAGVVREGLLAKLRRRLHGPPPFFEMHVVPRTDVEVSVNAAGGVVLHAIDDGAAGAGWLSYTYVCRRLA